MNPKETLKTLKEIDKVLKSINQEIKNLTILKELGYDVNIFKKEAPQVPHQGVAERRHFMPAVSDKATTQELKKLLNEGVPK